MTEVQVEIRPGAEIDGPFLVALVRSVDPDGGVRAQGPAEGDGLDSTMVLTGLLEIYAAVQLVRLICATVIGINSAARAFQVVDLRESPPKVTVHPEVQGLRGRVLVVAPDGSERIIGEPTGEGLTEILRKAIEG